MEQCVDSGGWPRPGAGGPRRRPRRPGPPRAARSRVPVGPTRASATASAATRARSTGSRSQRPALVEPRQQQQFLDQHAHARRLLLDAPHGEVEVLGPVLGAAAEQLGVAADRGERRAQLVRRLGEEAPQGVLGRLSCRANACSIWASIALRASPRRPTSVRGVGAARRGAARSPAAIAPAVTAMSSSGRISRRTSHQASRPKPTSTLAVTIPSTRSRRPSVCAHLGQRDRRHECVRLPSSCAGQHAVARRRRGRRR